MATPLEIRRIYGLAKGAGIDDNDDLHAVVEGVTGSTSIKALTTKQINAVSAELISRMRLGASAPPEPPRHTGMTENPGMMTIAQQKLAWRLIYRLMELDRQPKLHEDGSTYTPAERLCGAVKKELAITAPPTDPLRFVSFERGEKLIESLKRYVRSAEKRGR